MTEEEHEEFMIKCSELIPPSYDGDESVETILLGYLKDMADFGAIVARLTSDYR